MNLLITGALGHIGSRLIRSIRSGVYGDVILLDDLSTQRHPSLFNLPDEISFRFIEGDILTVELEKLLRGVDVVVHLAARTNAEASVEIAKEVERINFEGTERVARGCAASGSRLIFLSTTSVYGVQRDEVDEECPIDHLKPQSPYAESKLKAELSLKEMQKSAGLRFITCRFGTIFGPSPGMRFHTAVNKFIWQACMGIPLTVWSSALDQNRPYLDLEDAVRAIHFIIERDLFSGETYNVLTMNATVRQIVDAISEFVPDVNVSLVNSRIMNQLSYTVSCRKFTDLGFQFSGSLRQRVAESVALLKGVRKFSGTAAQPSLPSAQPLQSL
jgi:nucleoside-diphosphate-sugar epimerase